MCNTLTGLLLLAAVSVAAGIVVYNGEFTCLNSDNWTAVTLDKPYRTNPREQAYQIKYPKAFETAPKVLLSVTSLDSAQDKNLRYKTDLYSVTSTGFIGRCYTWSDTYIYKIRVSWIAIGN